MQALSGRPYQSVGHRHPRRLGPRCDPHGYVEHEQKTVMVNRWCASLPFPTLFLCPALPDERR
jgi:hypothetical protein